MLSYKLLEIKTYPFVDEDTKETKYTLNGKFEVYNTEIVGLTKEVTKRIGVYTPASFTITYDLIDCPKKVSCDTLLTTDYDKNPKIIKELLDISYFYYIKNLNDIKTKFSKALSDLECLKIISSKQFVRPLYTREDRNALVSPLETITNKLEQMTKAAALNEDNAVIRLYMMFYKHFCDRDENLFCQVIDAECEMLKDGGFKFYNVLFPNGVEIKG